MTDDLFWWQQIPSAARCVARVTQEICAHHMVLLHIPEHLPWKETFRNLVEEGVHAREDRRSLRCIEAMDVGTSLGDYLLHHFCKPAVQDGFRPSLGYAGYLAGCQDTTLGTSYLYLKEVEADVLPAWAAFLGSYREKFRAAKKQAHLSGDGFACLLETTAEEPLAEKGLVEIFLADELTAYDSVIFSAFRAGDAQLYGTPDVVSYLRPYLAEVVTQLAGRDTELAAALLQQGQALLETPMEAVSIALEAGRYSDGAPFPACFSEDAVHRAFWTAQVRLLFPYLEEQRIAFLERHAEEAKRLLPYENGNHETVSDLPSIEIGKIYYEIGRGGLQASERERDAVALHRSARNDLAHLKPLALDVLKAVYQKPLA